MTNVDSVPNQNQSTRDVDDHFPPSVPHGFTINDASSANSVVRKIIEARAYGERVSNWAAAEIRRAENEERFFYQRFASHLETWARQQLHATNSRRHSIALPSGTIGFRSAASRLVIADERTLLDWCGRHLPAAVAMEVKAIGSDAASLRAWHRDHCPAAVAVESVRKSVLDEHFRATGECPQGAECATGEKFFIR